MQARNSIQPIPVPMYIKQQQYQPIYNHPTAQRYQQFQPQRHSQIPQQIYPTIPPINYGGPRSQFSRGGAGRNSGPRSQQMNSRGRGSPRYAYHVLQEPIETDNTQEETQFLDELEYQTTQVNSSFTTIPTQEDIYITHPTDQSLSEFEEYGQNNFHY